MANAAKEKHRGDISQSQNEVQTQERYRKYLTTVILSCAVLVAAGLSFYNLDNRSLWIDETCSIAFAHLDWSGFWSVLTLREANMGLYYLLLRAWLLFGDGEFAVRSLSVIFAVGTVPIVYLIGRRLFTERVGITAAWLLACNAFFIRYAQEARSYTLLLFLICVSTYFFIRCMEEPAKKNWAAYCLISILAAYAHFFAILVIVSHAASILFLRRKDVPWRGLLLSAAVIITGLIPVLIFMVTRDIGQIDWIPRMNALSLPGLFLTLSGEREIPAGLVYFIFLLMALLPYLEKRRDPCEPGKNRHCSALLVWLIMPIVMVMLLSIAKPMFLSRYFMISLPFLILLTAVGLAGINRSRIYGACFAIAVIISTIAVLRSYETDREDDWRSATNFIMSSAQPRDAIIFYTPYNKVPFEYYRNKLLISNDPLLYAYPTKPGLETILKKEPLNENLLYSLRKQDHKIWLVLSRGKKDVKELLQNRLSTLYRVQHVREFYKIKVIQYYN